MLCVLLGPASASAQPTTALDRMAPAPAGDRFLTVPAASVSDDLRFSAALVGSWAGSPLRLRVQSAQRPDEVVPLVRHQASLHALASLEFARRWLLEASVPLVFAQDGEAARFELPPAQGTSLGDVRFGGRVEVAEGQGAWPSVAAAVAVWVPTGGSGAYDGAPTVRVAPRLIVSAEQARYAWSATLARTWLPGRNDSLLASEVSAALAAALRIDRWQLGPELTLTHAAESAPLRFGARTGAELLATARVRLGALVVSLGGGPGVGGLPGTPTYRLLAGVAWAPEPTRSEPPAPAAAPEPPGALTPSPLTSSATPAGSAAAPGAPAPDSASPPAAASDRDGDGISDAQDACPDAAGVASLDPARQGCPPDRDGDGVIDAQDACPDERGERSERPEDSGCPRSVRVQGEQIVILQQVTFTTGRDQIEESSFGLLAQVADVLQQKPEIARLAIDGHTDDRGDRRANLELSRRRALAVQRWLVDHGIDARRLEARGFGPKRPLTSNATEPGRQKNRRVEFQILHRTARGAEGWREGGFK